MNDLTTANGTVPSSVHLLLVEPDASLAEHLTTHLAEAFAGVLVTRCDSLAEAEVYLAGTAFDVVCTADTLPDGSGLDLLPVRDSLGLSSPVVVRTQFNGAFHAKAQQAGAAACFSFEAHADDMVNTLARVLRRPSTEGPSAYAESISDTEASVLLDSLRAETGVVAHAINNPLTVITGNVQLLREVAQVSDVDPLLAGPIDDIGTAAQQLTEALDQLTLLRQRIAVALGSDDRL